MQEKTARRTNPERTAATRAKLIAAARRLFAEKGYAETGTPEIVKAAGVTRGALYHHFEGKEALFAAVARAEADDVRRDILADSLDVDDPMEALMAGADAYFRSMATPGRARILLIDGPSALGLEVMHEIDAAAGGDELKAGLEAAGAGDAESLDALADLLSVAFDRAALAIASGAEAAPYRAALRSILEGVVSLRPEAAP